MASKPQTIYHLRVGSPIAVCGAVAVWPNRAVVSLDLFRVQARKYGSRTCAKCKAHMAQLPDPAASR